MVVDVREQTPPASGMAIVLEGGAHTCERPFGGTDVIEGMAITATYTRELTYVLDQQVVRDEERIEAGKRDRMGGAGAFRTLGGPPQDTIAAVVRRMQSALPRLVLWGMREHLAGRADELGSALDADDPHVLQPLLSRTFRSRSLVDIEWEAREEHVRVRGLLDLVDHHLEHADLVGRAASDE